MSLVPVKEFTDAADLLASRRALRAQFYGKPAPKPAKAPQPVVVAPPEPEPEPAPIDEREQAIRDWLSLASPGSVRASAASMILDIVAKHTGYNRVALISESRHAPLVRARQMAYWLMRRHTGLSLPSIGHRIGGRDHTTVLSGFRKIKFLMSEDQDFAALMRTLSAEVEAKAQEGREQ